MLLAVLLAAGCGSSQPVTTTKVRTATSGETTSTFPIKSYNLVLISARSGAVLRTWDTDLRSGVSDLAVSSAVADGRGGWFISGGFGLARMLPSGKLDTAWGTPQSRSLECLGRCLLVRAGSRLYVEGSRTHVVPPNAENQVSVIEAFDAERGERLWVSPELSQTVYALAASSSRVYVGGNFAVVGTVTRRRLAAFDANTGRLLDWRAPSFHFEPQASASVFALALAGSRLYVGGAFYTVGNSSRDSVAALDPVTGALLPWKLKIADAYGTSEILVTHGQVIVSGDDGFGAASARTGRQLDWTSRIGGIAGRFAARGPLVYLGGGLRWGFDRVDGDGRHNLAAFNLRTQRFTSWAPYLGVDYVDVGEIVPSGERVLVLGMFTNSSG